MPVALSATDVAVPLANGNVAVLDGATGALRWTAVTGSSAAQPPSVDGTNMYVGTADGKVRSFSVYACGNATCPPVWTSTKSAGAAIVSRPVVAGGVVYAGTAGGAVAAFDASNGTRLASIVVDASSSRVNVIEDGGTVYASTNSGVVAAYARRVSPMRIVVLGAGFGGLELTTRLSDEFGADVDVVLIDRTEDFVFGFSKLDVMFGRMPSEHVRHSYRDLVKPGVRFVQSTIRSIDPSAKRVETDAGPFDADILVVALGAELHPEATPGFVEGGYDFYTEATAFALHDVLAAFGGGRVIVAVTSTPFKCPPAPSETALLMHEFLTARGLRDRSSIALVMPMPVPIPPSPDASKALIAAFAERDIEWHPNTLVRALDPQRKVAIVGDGTEFPYDLFLGVPEHRVPEVVAQSGLAVDGWIPVNPLTLETSFPGVYAVGDVANAGTPKAGVFAEGQAAAAASGISARVRSEGEFAHYDGRGICYVEFGHHQVAKVDVMFTSGEMPRGTLEGPSSALADEKHDFGSSRVKRWFGRTWP